ASGERAVAEITPTSVVVRSGADGAALISTNHHRGTNQDSSGRCSRYDYLHDTAKKSFGSVGEKSIEGMLDHVAQGDMTLQSMIFEPANRVIYLADGADATKHEFGRLDLPSDFI